MSLRKEDQLFTIDYPESDGEPMAETDVHYRLLTDLRFELEQFFHDDSDIELSSRETWREDLNTKWRLYEDLGVTEYFIFDPEYDYLVEPLIAWRLESGRYEAVEVIHGAVKSEVLDLELVDTGETLRLRNPVTGQFLRTPFELAEETDRLRREVEQLRGNG
jgi:hypothetical protein